MFHVRTNERRSQAGVVVMVMLLTALAAACTSDNDEQSTGGAVGLPTPTRAEQREAAMLRDGGLVLIEAPGAVRVISGSGSHDLSYSLVHFGTTSEAYEIEASTDLAFVDLSSVPAVVELQPDERLVLPVSILVSSDVRPGTRGEVTIRVKLLRDKRSSESATTLIAVVPSTG